MTDIAKQHQLKIARWTLEMSEEFAVVMGPPTHVQALRTLLENGWTPRKLRSVTVRCGHDPDKVDAWVKEAQERGDHPPVDRR